MFGSHARHYGIETLYATAGTVEHGVSLFEINAPHATAVHVASSPPSPPFSVPDNLDWPQRDGAFWGILRSSPANQNVIDYDMPWGATNLGAGSLITGLGISLVSSAIL